MLKFLNKNLPQIKFDFSKLTYYGRSRANFICKSFEKIEFLKLRFDKKFSCESVCNSLLVLIFGAKMVDL